MLSSPAVAKPVEHDIGKLPGWHNKFGDNADYTYTVRLHETGHNHDGARKYHQAAAPSEGSYHHGLPPLTYQPLIDVHKAGHKAYHDDGWKYHHAAANGDHNGYHRGLPPLK
jgi:hypothetical protein